MFRASSKMIPQFSKLVLLVCFVAVSGCQTTSGTSPISAIVKRQIEQRQLDYPSDTIYGAVIAVLVDQGYTIANSDKAGGLIVAEKFGEKRQWGLVAYDRDVFSASVIISAIAPSSTNVRFTVRKKTFSNMGYGEGVKEVEEIVAPSMSQSFYSLLLSEAERRKAGFN